MLTPKTLGLPADLLTRLEAKAETWNTRRGTRPKSLPDWKTCTWADVVRQACAEYLARKQRKQSSLAL